MATKQTEPKEVVQSINNKVAELNSLLRLSRSAGITVVIKPDNEIPLTDDEVPATKAVMGIVYRQGLS